MQFVTTVLTLIFEAGLKELGEHYVTTCMSFHMICQTPNTKLSGTPPSPNNLNSNKRNPSTSQD